jgi:hypothetical protein
MKLGEKKDKNNKDTKETDDEETDGNLNFI